MGEIVQIHIGQAGIQIGTEIWDLLHQEYSLEKNGHFKEETQKSSFTTCQPIIHKLFKEQPSQRYYPRCIFLDTEPTCIDIVRKGELKKLLNPQNMINGKEAGAYYSRSYYTIGRELVDKSLDRIRKEVENCSSFQGFILNHSICGGTGSGLACNLMSDLDVSYGKKVKVTFPLFPSLHQQGIVEPYNATLSIGCLIEHIDLANCIDNTALYNILAREDQLDFITYKDINRLIAQMQSSLLANYIQNGMLQFSSNLVPYPRIHFIRGATQPIQCKNRQRSLPNLIKNCFSNDWQYLTVNRRGKLLSSAVIGRGDIAPVDLIKQVQNQISYFDTVEWIPDNQLLIEEDSTQRLTQSVSAFQNNTSIQDNFNLIADRFDKLYEKRGFVHWFSGEGMESGEFSAAREELYSISNDYSQQQAEEDII